MSSTNSNKFVLPGLKLLIKYVGNKHMLTGALSDYELDFLKNMIALNEQMYYSILHTFNVQKQPIIEHGKVSYNPFLKSFYKYYDIKHNMWGLKGLCPNHAYQANSIIGHSQGYARIDPSYMNELQGKTYSYQYKRVCQLDVPWKSSLYHDKMNAIMSECAWKPFIGTAKSQINETVINGLFVRVKKDEMLKMLNDKKIMDNPKSTDNDWGYNIPFKYSLINISCEHFKNNSIGKDMKTILTPIVLSNDDMIPAIKIPDIIYKHKDRSVPLKRYQLANVEWMVNMENDLDSYSVNVPQTLEIIPRLHFDQITKTVYSKRKPTISYSPKGGGIFDEVGLGKTLTCITLISVNQAPESIRCKELNTRVIKSEQPVCEALIKTGKRVKENGGKPVTCGRIIKESKPKPTPVAKKQKTDTKPVAFLLKHKVCNMHAKTIEEKDTPSQPEVENDSKKTEESSGMNQESSKHDDERNTLKKKEHRWMSRATLVVCPNQIPYQWVSQIKEYTNPSLKVHCVTNVHEARKLTYRDVINADVIVTTIDCIERGTVTAEGEHSKRTIENHLSQTDLDTNCPYFETIYWHRVIIDEIHRITNKKYRYVMPRIFNIRSTYRWAVTGTPFQKDQLNYDIIVSWLFGDSKYNSDERQRIFSKIQGQSDILTSLFRRNTKKSTEHLIPIGCDSLDEQNNKLWQTVTQTEIWLDLSKIERAMYTARKACKPHWTKDRDDEYLRQICCHPNLSSENSKIVESVNRSVTGGNRYATDANDVKKALLNHNLTLIKGMLTKTIPEKIEACWTAQEAYLVDVEDKKPRMAYYNSVHQLKRAFFKLYQFRKSHRAYTDINNQNNAAIVLTKCDSCMKNIQVSSSIDIYVGECGHTFCGGCSKSGVPKVKIDDNYVQTDIVALVNGQKDGDGDGNTDENVNENTKEDTSEPKKKKAKKEKEKKPRAKKSYEKKIVDGCTKCSICSEKVVTIGMIDAISVDPTELMMDMNNNNSNSNSNNTSPEHSDDEHESGDYKLQNYIPKGFKDEMASAIGLYGTKITHLVGYLKTYTQKPHDNRIIIFSQWDNLLLGIMETLKNFDLPAMMCKGNVFQKKKAIQNFKTNNYYKIILLSSKYAASGLDLIEANKVIFIDPIYGDFDTVKQIEDQAIGRAHRLGQKNPIEVVRFLIKDTIEEECFKDWKETISKNDE